MTNNSLVTADTWLTEATQELKQAGIPSARLDALILLEDELTQDRAHLLAHIEQKISSKQLSHLASLLERRKKREPLAYIRGHVAFYGRDFHANSSVLIPRPESEDFITVLKKLPLKAGQLLLDVGTGSGALGITAALELPFLKVYVSDIDEDCLEAVQVNAKSLRASVSCLQSDLLQRIDIHPDVIVANLPYVPNATNLEPELSYEPNLALFSPANGLAHYQALWQQIAKLPSKLQYVLTESLPQQHQQMQKLATQAGYKLVQTHGLVQLFIH